MKAFVRVRYVGPPANIGSYGQLVTGSEVSLKWKDWQYMTKNLEEDESPENFEFIEEADEDPGKEHPQAEDTSDTSSVSEPEEPEGSDGKPPRRGAPSAGESILDKPNSKKELWDMSLEDLQAWANALELGIDDDDKKPYVKGIWTHYQED